VETLTGCGHVPVGDGLALADVHDPVDRVTITLDRVDHDGGVAHAHTAQGVLLDDDSLSVGG